MQPLLIRGSPRNTDDCARRIFTERLPQTAATYARRTQRMAQALFWLGLALGGEAGARTAQRLGLMVSGDTLLRHLRRMAQKSARIAHSGAGIDDWAWRKGQRYETILCDLERRCVVDLLPDRQSQTVTEWLRAHAPPEIISRDRAGAYAEAARQGAPHAIQVADRFHLLRNLREAVERVLTRHGPLIEEAFRQSTPTRVVPSLPLLPKTTSTGSQQLSRARRQGRFARYQQVVELHEQGVSKRAIALQLGLNRKTVRGWLHAGRFPERQVTQRRSAVDRWLSYLEMRWAEGCHNRSQLWRELRGQERGLPRSPCAAGSVCASGSVGAVPRVRFLHPGNVLVRGKRVRSCSVSFATQLPRNRNSPKPFAGFLPRLPPPQN